MHNAEKCREGCYTYRVSCCEVRDRPGVFENIRSFKHWICTSLHLGRVVISNTILDDNPCLSSCSYFLVFCFTMGNKHVFSPCLLPACVIHFLCFLTSLPCQESISDHAVRCEFASSRCTLSVLKFRNRCTDTPRISVYK